MGNMLAGPGPSSFDLPEFSTDGGAERFLDLSQQQVALLVRSGLNLDMVLNPFQMRRLGTSTFPTGEEGEGEGDASGDEDGKAPVRFGVHWNVPAHISSASITIDAVPAETNDPLSLDGQSFFLRFVYSAAVPCIATITPLALEAPHPISGKPIYATVPAPAPARTPAPSSAPLPVRVAAARAQLDSDLAALARPLTMTLHPGVSAAAELPLPPLVVLALAAAAGADVPAALARACCSPNAPARTAAALASGGGALSPAVAALLARVAPARGGAGAGRAPLLPLVLSVTAAVPLQEPKVDEVPALCPGEGASAPSGSSAADPSRRGWASVVTLTATFSSTTAPAAPAAASAPASAAPASAQPQGQPDAATMRSARAAAFQAQLARNNARLVSSINGPGGSGGGAGPGAQGPSSPSAAPAAAEGAVAGAAQEQGQEGEGVGAAAARLAASLHTATTRAIVIGTDHRDIAFVFSMYLSLFTLSHQTLTLISHFLPLPQPKLVSSSSSTSSASRPLRPLPPPSPRRSPWRGRGRRSPSPSPLALPLPPPRPLPLLIASSAWVGQQRLCSFPAGTLPSAPRAPCSSQGRTVAAGRMGRGSSAPCAATVLLRLLLCDGFF